MRSECDVSVVLRVRDEEERIGRVADRLSSHLRQLGLRFELLVADEGSGDNTLAVTAILRRTVSELRVLHCEPSEGIRTACAEARGCAVLVYDVGTEAAPAALNFALERLRAGRDLVVVPNRYIVFRRTRAWRAFDALAQSRHALAEQRFLRRARAMGLQCDVTHVRHRRFPFGFGLRPARDHLRALFFSTRSA
jgi:glycosyltransferase involved in cell wall biosynthesis